MNEISSPRPLPPPVPANRGNAANVDLAVKLLQPLDDLIAVGETAKAEVVTSKELANSFQVLLRLTLNNGKQTTLEATSPRALEQGSAVNLTALSPTRLALSVLGNNHPPLTSLDREQFPAGSLLQGKVLSSNVQAGSQPLVYKVLMQLLNSQMAGSTLSIETALKLPVGSLLSAQVQNDQSLNFLPLSGRLDQLALNQQLSAQLGRQGSLQGLFNNLQGLLGGAGLSEGLRSNIEKLFAGLPDAAQLSNPKGLAQALHNSGIFLEGKLIGGQGQALSTDLKANLLRLLSQLSPGLAGAGALGSSGSSAAMAQAMPAIARDLLQSLGRANQRQLEQSFPLPARLLQKAQDEDDLESLLKLAAAAIARLQTHQLSSLSQSQVGPDGNLLTTWQLEIPMRNQQDVVPLQVKLQREEGQDSEKKEAKETLWRVELAFDIPPLGPLQIQAELVREQFSSQLWAQQADTAKLIESELDNLRARLQTAGIHVGELLCTCGVPPRGQRTTLEQRWVDETA
ncbi:flagellar hook-length control protein FliK [Pseudomonas sp. 5P_3.1_Bac2]|uniref:flagellar hook-length control protein FliK n=1 Tax=Pseudomonas sp. 5P_3.1_Bac2 TaxID=2971617 RepID=UPI0021C6952B|nr:flagellar hook-length control protein FliK [Pseudomonas sp. 5P_3.1_Bac2]MCU1715975.1 flagellar hook-length control protein FliK [Pseudomonas sp. 5P_3.1_Bac2]